MLIITILINQLDLHRDKELPSISIRNTLSLTVGGGINEWQFVHCCTYSSESLELVQLFSIIVIMLQDKGGT
jgi:hypothetical protein